jgi:hypothetical protein
MVVLVHVVLPAEATSQKAIKYKKVGVVAWADHHSLIQSALVHRLLEFITAALHPSCSAKQDWLAWSSCWYCCYTPDVALVPLVLLLLQTGPMLWSHKKPSTGPHDHGVSS